MNTRGSDLFLKTDAKVAAQFGKVSDWVMDQQYEPSAIHTFLQNTADYYLIAHALAGGHVVVSHEVASNSPRKVKIPNVCIGLSISFMTPFEMLRKEKARFVLGKNP